MKKSLLLAIASLGFIGCATSDSTVKRYVCGCGADCPSCKTVSDKPGKCECGKPLVAQ